MFEEYLNLRTALIGLVVFLVVYYLVKKAKQKKYKIAPGPMAWPLFGNLPLLVWHSDDGLGLFTNLATRYGQVYSLWLGPKYTVMLNGYDAIYEALVQKQNDFAGRPQLKSGKMFTDGGNDIFMGDFGPIWKLQRKIAHSAVRAFTQGQKLEDLVNGCFEQTAKTWSETKEPYNARESLSLLMINIIATMCYGIRYEIDHPEFQELYQMLINSFDALGSGFATDFLPDWMEFVEHKKLKTAKDIMHKYLGFINNKVKEHRETYEPENLRDFTDHMIQFEKQAALEEDSELFKGLTEQHFVQIISDIFAAGLDTSRETLYFLLTFCVLHPQVQDRLCLELDDVVGKERMPTLTDLPNLPYCEAVLYETLRMSSIVPIAAHKTTSDTSVFGHDIPKDTLVIFNLFDMHFDPSEWKEPKKFIPERFLDKNGTIAPKPRALMPFSAGRRVCLGEALARRQLHYLVALIFHQFTFSLPDGEEKPDINGKSSFMQRSAKDFKLIIHKRK